MNNFKLQWVVEGVLARSHRPCYWDEKPAAPQLKKWLCEVGTMKIRGILCLLSQSEMDEHYGTHKVDLLPWYRSRGFVVSHVPVPDYLQPPLRKSDLTKIWSAFQKLPQPCLIHCSAGIDRTGAAVEFINKAMNVKSKTSLHISKNFAQIKKVSKKQRPENTKRKNLRLRLLSTSKQEISITGQRLKHAPIGRAESVSCKGIPVPDVGA